MAFFKKPVVTVLVSIILVMVATLVSVNVKLNRECRSVADGFYTGTLYDGVEEESLFERINTVRGYADELSIIASDNGVDNENLIDFIDDMQYAFTSSHYDISYIHYTYENLYAEMLTVVKSLSDGDISGHDASAVERISEEMRTVHQEVLNSGYNDSVREYLLGYERFPTALLGGITGVDAPEYFS